MDYLTLELLEKKLEEFITKVQKIENNNYVVNTGETDMTNKEISTTESNKVNLGSDNNLNKINQFSKEIEKNLDSAKNSKKKVIEDPEIPKKSLPEKEIPIEISITRLHTNKEINTRKFFKKEDSMKLITF